MENMFIIESKRPISLEALYPIKRTSFLGSNTINSKQEYYSKEDSLIMSVFAKTSRNTIHSQLKRPVARNLFGTPSQDSKIEFAKRVEECQTKAIEKFKEKWNFDPIAEIPCKSDPNHPKPFRYEWEPVIPCQNISQSPNIIKITKKPIENSSLVNEIERKDPPITIFSPLSPSMLHKEFNTPSNPKKLAKITSFPVGTTKKIHFKQKRITDYMKVKRITSSSPSSGNRLSTIEKKLASPKASQQILPPFK